MKTLFTAAVLLSLSGTAFAGAEVPQDTIPGYGVETYQPSQTLIQRNIQGSTRSEPLAYTIPGYGVVANNQNTTNKSFNPTAIGSFEVDYLNMSYQQ